MRPANLHLILFATSLILTMSCAPEKRLDAHALLGRTPAALQARLGEPKQHREEIEDRMGVMNWTDVEGVKVFAAIKKGKAIYITYNFISMDTFDEAAAFRTIGVKRPEAEPEKLSKSNARRWQPFETYDRLTINPDTKLISIGSHPFADLPEEQGPVAGEQ